MKDRAENGPRNCPFPEDRLIEMHLSAIADAFVLQEGNPSIKEVAFEERFGMFIDAEYKTRKNATKGLTDHLPFRKMIICSFVLSRGTRRLGD